MYTIPFHPDAQSYTAKPPKEAVREIQLEGGANYRRAGLRNGTWLVPVQFTCDRARYDVLNGFYELWEIQPQFFKVNLILNNHEVQEYEASFVADTWQLTSQRGHEYVIGVTLEVKPKRVPVQDNLNIARAIFVSIYRDEVIGRKVAMDPLYEVMNVIMPFKEDDHVH